MQTSLILVSSIHLHSRAFTLLTAVPAIIVSTFRNVDKVVDSITNAYAIIEESADSLEPQWALYGSKMLRDEVAANGLETKEKGVQGEQINGGQMDREEEDKEDLNDHKSLDLEVIKRNTIY